MMTVKNCNLSSQGKVGRLLRTNTLIEGLPQKELPLVTRMTFGYSIPYNLPNV